MGAEKGLGHRNNKGATKDCFIFGIWFTLKRLAEAVMDVGAYMVGIVKTNKKGFCKYTIDNLKKYLTGGSCFVLNIKSMVTWDGPLIVISYKYNTRKVISLIATEDTGITKSGITYLHKYPDQFSNAVIFPVYHILVMYKFFLFFYSSRPASVSQCHAYSSTMVFHTLHIVQRDTRISPLG